VTKLSYGEKDEWMKHHKPRLIRTSLPQMEELITLKIKQEIAESQVRSHKKGKKHPE